jgi:hypothetical protein
MTKTLFPQNPTPEPKAQKAQQNMTHTMAILAMVMELSFFFSVWPVIGCYPALRTRSFRVKGHSI